MDVKLNKVFFKIGYAEIFLAPGAGSLVTLLPMRLLYRDRCVVLYNFNSALVSKNVCY